MTILERLNKHLEDVAGVMPEGVPSTILESLDAMNEAENDGPVDSGTTIEQALGVYFDGPPLPPLPYFNLSYTGVGTGTFHAAKAYPPTPITTAQVGTTVFLRLNGATGATSDPRVTLVMSDSRPSGDETGVWGYFTMPMSDIVFTGSNIPK